MNKTSYILVLCVISVFAVLIYNSQLEKKSEPSRYINPSYELQETMLPLPPLTTEEKEAIRIKSNYSNIIAIGKIVDASKGTKRFPHAAIKIETVIKLDPESAVNKTQVLDKYIRLNKKPQTGVNYYRLADKMGQYYLIFGHIEKSIKDPYTKNNLRIITSSESMVATQEGLNNAQDDIVFLGKIKVMPSHWSIPNHYQYQLRAFSIHNILHGFVTGKELHVRYTMPSQGSEHSALTLNTYNRDQYYWIQANKILGTKQYYAKAIGADLTREIAFLKQLHTEVSNNSLSNTETLFQLAENNQKPYDLNVDYKHIETLTDEEERRLAKLYNSEHIDIIAVGRLLNLSPEGDQIYSAIVLEEILKLGDDFVKYKEDILKHPIRIVRPPMHVRHPTQHPNHSGSGGFFGKYFVVFGDLRSVKKQVPYDKNDWRIFTSLEYVIVTQGELNRASADVLCLGKVDRGTVRTLGSEKFRTVTFNVVKLVTRDTINELTVRYPYEYTRKRDDTPYSLDVLTMNDQSKYYWLVADKIKGTEEYNAVNLGMDITRELSYLRQLNNSNLEIVE